MPSRPQAVIERLRNRIRAIETGARTPRRVLPFGVEALDQARPHGGLGRGALHDVGGGATGASDGAAAALFAAGIVARSPGWVLWCLTRPDLFAPALVQAGLDHERTLFAEASDEKTVLACFEEGLRHGGLGAVVAEVARLSMTASRRLQLAAETSGTMGIAVRRWRRQTDAADFGQPTSAVTRWRISALPSTPLPVSGIGRAHWLVELIRCRAGECAEFIVEACDEEGRLAVPADLADRPAASRHGCRRTSA